MILIKTFLVMILLLSTNIFALDNKENNNYKTNNVNKTKINVFGENLFHGNFSKNQNLFNENYKINFKDKLKLEIWGEINESIVLKVDLKGNVFIPNIGIIHAQGLSSKILLNKVKKKLHKLYKSNIYVYINILTYEEINILIMGKVNNPGSYKGYPNDLIINYLDKANGIQIDGNYRDVLIKRHNKIVKRIDLYNYLENGDIDFFQFKNGDVIFIPDNKNYIYINIENKRYKYELKNKKEEITKILKNFNINKKYNEIIIKRQNNNIENFNIKSINKDVLVKSYDDITLMKTTYSTNIKIKIKDDVNNVVKYVTLDKKNTFKQIMYKLNLLEDDLYNIKIYRKSIAKKQKQNIDRELNFLSKSLAFETSGTLEESQIRNIEYKNLQRFIEKARSVVPKGQVVITNIDSLKDFKLENEDTIEILNNNQIANIQGEVYFPNSYTINKNNTVKDLIEWSGGKTDRADTNRIFLLNKNGFIKKINNLNQKVTSSDTVFIMTKKDAKNFLFFKDITSVVYQIMLSAGVMLK